MLSPLLRFKAASKLLSNECRDVILKHNFPISLGNLKETKTYFTRIIPSSSHKFYCNTVVCMSTLNRPSLGLHENIVKTMQRRHASTDKTSNPTNVSEKPITNQKETVTRVQKLKKAVAEYGSTVIIFHVTLSLMSLGICYALVSSGVDASQVFLSLGLQENKIAANAGTFVAAYAVHKIMAPLRISITLGATPLIVRYLRNKGILKK